MIAGDVMWQWKMPDYGVRHFRTARKACLLLGNEDGTVGGHNITEVTSLLPRPKGKSLSHLVQSIFSRFLLSEGNSEDTKNRTQMKKATAEMGCVRNTQPLPSPRISACLRLRSNMGPNTNANKRGAAS